MQLNRRTFLKALGLGGSSSVVAACGLDDNRYFTPIEQVLPYVVRPEQVTPGVNAHFATYINEGLGAYPVLAVHRDGRVINVRANLEAPTPSAVPSTALLELQRHYSPDRITQPQSGGASGEPISWEKGLSSLAESMQSAIKGGKKIAYLGHPKNGTILELIDSVTQGNAVFWEPLGRAAEATASEMLFGERRLPRYSLSKAQYVLSFGANFLGSWGGAKLEAEFAEAKNPNIGHFVNRLAWVSPFRNQTGANADDWFQCIPGTEALVAFAVARLVADIKHYSGPLNTLLRTVDPAKMAESAGVDINTLNSIAQQFTSGTSVALPGGVASASGQEVDLAIAAYLINIVGGAEGSTFFRDGYEGPIDGMNQVQDLLDDLNSGKVGVLLLDDVNPVYSLPKSMGVADAFKKADAVIGLSSHPDESIELASVVLPTSNGFENWGDAVMDDGVTLIRQPAMSPLHDTRALGDILLAGLRSLNRTSFSGNWHEYLQQKWANAQFSTNDGDEAENAGGDIQSRAFKTWWADSLRNGTIPAEGNKVQENGAISTSGIAVPRAPAASEDGEYFLHMYPHPFIGDGRYANQPWAQEVPDPLTGQVWDSWATVHPETAEAMGLSDNDLVEVKTENGTVSLGVEISQLTRRDTIAIPLGGGHTQNGRYANGVGINVVDLLGVSKNARGDLGWEQARVGLAATGQEANLTSTFGNDTDNDRNFAVQVDAAALAKSGDGKSDNPGELTGIHYLVMDKRLRDAGKTNFYGLTDHPTYRFGMTVDTNACTGCGACSIACYAENNLPVVGKEKVGEGREMGWIRISRFFKNDAVHFVPSLCQHCGHAPCESVCPVLATYHNLDGLNAMIYNRCVGTRYCSNACPYSARRFNYHTYVWPEPFNLQLNPDVAVREMGIMEKCTFCVQRIRKVKGDYRDISPTAVVPDESLRQLPACAEACPSQALTFGNLNDPDSVPSTTRQSGRHYELLEDLNVFPAINYLAKASFHGTGHAGHGDAHGETHSGNDHAPASADAEAH